MIDYKWINGAVTHCQCGQIGIWNWTEKDCFEIRHSENDVCLLKTITSRQERSLRIARSRKHPY